MKSALLRLVLSAQTRFKPVFAKISRKSPFCPWSVCFSLLNPNFRFSRPRLQIREVEKNNHFVKLLFQNKVAFWFPNGVQIDEELWGEYLSVFWDSPSNFHNYFSRSHKIEKGDVVIDCGACEGFFTSHALQQGASKIFAIEPNPLMIECLRKTFKKEILYGQVELLSCALGDSEKGVFLSCDSKNPFSGKVSSSGFSIQQKTLDSLFLPLNLKAINFIKMDLEGFESLALIGGQALIRHFSPRLSITTYHFERDYQKTLDLILKLGYGTIKPRGVTTRGGSLAFRPSMVHATKR